jgi:hypothetical protein
MAPKHINDTYMAGTTVRNALEYGASAGA